MEDGKVTIKLQRGPWVHPKGSLQEIEQLQRKLQEALSPPVARLVWTFGDNVRESIRQMAEGLITPAESINFLYDQLVQMVDSVEYMELQRVDEALGRTLKKLQEPRKLDPSKMSGQEVFVALATHLLKQARRSHENGSCRYRGPEGRCCPAGLFMTDSEAAGAEGRLWSDLVDSDLSYLKSNHDALIRSFQKIHDDVLPSGWPREIEELAYRGEYDTESLKVLLREFKPKEN